MKSIAVSLVWLLVASSAMADPPTRPGEIPAIPNASIRFMPSLDKVLARAVRNGHDLTTSVNVTYDELGNVTAVTLDKRTGDNTLDKAILAWAALVKIQAIGAGSGKLPVKIAIGE
jgi:hypothetical protein